MKMYDNTEDEDKNVSYTFTDKSVSDTLKAFRSNLKFFSSTKKDIAQHAFLNWYDIAVYDGEHENISMKMIEAVTTKDRFRDAIKSGYAPLMLPNFDDVENYIVDRSDEQFIYIVYCDDRKTVWDVINGDDITW